MRKTKTPLFVISIIFLAIGIATLVTYFNGKSSDRKIEVTDSIDVVSHLDYEDDAYDYNCTISGVIKNVGETDLNNVTLEVLVDSYYMDKLVNITGISIKAGENYTLSYQFGSDVSFYDVDDVNAFDSIGAIKISESNFDNGTSTILLVISIFMFVIAGAMFVMGFVQNKQLKMIEENPHLMDDEIIENVIETNKTTKTCPYCGSENNQKIIFQQVYKFKKR